MAKTINLIPQGVREGVSEKSQKPYKFFSYFVVELKRFASSANELHPGDAVSLVFSSDNKYITLVSGTSFAVEVNE